MRGLGGFDWLALRTRLGLERAVGPYVPRPDPEAPHVEIHYRRLPDRVRRYRQELLVDDLACRVTLLVRPRGADPWRVAEGVVLEAGSSLLWFTFPGAWHEVAAFHDRHGRLLGHYTNIVRPPRLEGSRWEIDDLVLDVWQPRRGPPRVLDREEFREATARGWLDAGSKERARRECERVLRRARQGAWPPENVARTPLEAVPFLRLRRDAEGTYHASLASGRLVGYGLYLLGAVSLVSLGFAAFTDALDRDGTAQTAWLASMAAAAVALLPLTLTGRLPATRWPRPALTDERSLFIAALASGLAVLLLDGGNSLRSGLAAVYGVLATFLAIFAACRAWFDRAFPVVAVAGLAVSLLALAFLLL